jgi:hypothetical protein
LRAGAREFETELGEGRGFAFGDVGLAFGDGDGHGTSSGCVRKPAPSCAHFNFS